MVESVQLVSFKLESIAKAKKWATEIKASFKVRFLFVMILTRLTVLGPLSKSLLMSLLIATLTYEIHYLHFGHNGPLFKAKAHD
jgi:hypothetical protein